MNCVRCKIKKSIEEEKVCEQCLKELKQKFRRTKYKDILDDPEVIQLLNDYEESF